MTSKPGQDIGFGIDKIGFYPCVLSLDIHELCAYRSFDAENFCRRLYCGERSVIGPFEDVVTLAVNAAEPVLSDVERSRIGLLIVATESGVDQEKPISSWVHRLLGLPSHCRNFELKHACFGATAAVQMALAWLASQDDDVRALVISTDHALLGLAELQEPVLGAGAAAIVLSRNPRILAYDRGWSGVFAHEIADIFRPAPGVETGDADDSLTSYLDAVEETYAAYVKAVGQIDFDHFFSANIYHVPFGGLAERAHLKLARSQLGLSRADARAHFERKCFPSLTYNRRTGGIYGASTFLALIGLLDHAPDVQPGDRVSIFSYGSGSCAEFYSGVIQADARVAAGMSDVQRKLDARRSLTLSQYEACERSLDRLVKARDFAPDENIVPGLWEESYKGRHRLVLKGVRDYRRNYDWADA